MTGAAAVPQLPHPHRAFQVRLDIGGDTWDDIVGSVRHLADHIERCGPQCTSVSGGVSGGHIVTVKHDPAMTHERWEQELELYLAALDAQKQAAAERPSLEGFVEEWLKITADDGEGVSTRLLLQARAAYMGEAGPVAIGTAPKLREIASSLRARGWTGAIGMLGEPGEIEGGPGRCFTRLRLSPAAMAHLSGQGAAGGGTPPAQRTEITGGEA